MFFDTTYSLSIAYSAGAVVVEADDTPSQALPVKERNVYAVPFRAPLIEKVQSAVDEDKPILSGEGLVLIGKRLMGDIVNVRIDDLDITPSMSRVTDQQVEVTAAEVGTLSAGVHRASVVQPYLIGTPPTPHAGTQSNAMPFLVHPQITVDPPANVTGAGPNPRSADITVHFVPDVEANQRVTLLLNGIAAGVRSFSFRQDPPSADVSQITFELEGLDAGSYLLRVQVDGADSLLVEDTDPMSPTYGQWTGPKVVIP
jgi:hypothetical protein